MNIDWGTAAFLGVVIVIAGNQVVMRVAALRRSPWFFWSMQAVNIGVASSVIAFGLPGFAEYWFVPWILGLLLFFHVLQNNQTRVTFLRGERERELEEMKRERRSVEGRDDPL
jgi:hypothetical protein